MIATPAINRPMTSHEWAMLLALSALWGGSFFFTDVALRALPPFTLVLLRVAGAALILNATIPLLGLRLPTDARSWIAFFGMGLLNNAVPFCLIVWGQTHIVSGLAAILNATTPLWTVIVTHFFTAEEKMTGNRLAGVVIGLIGVTIMIGPNVFDGLGATILAQLAVLGAAISYAFAALFGRRFRRMGVAPMVTATGQVTASTLMVLPVALLVDHPWTLAMPGLSVWAAVLGIAALSTALAYVLYFRILATAGTTNLMLVTFLIPFSAILLGALVLAEQLDTKQFIGMMLIGMALAAIDGRLMKRFKLRFA
ncbi:DMT family transporter [Rhizobium sp. P44RR-XXIV]|uniref:DMT family transporter n=1 Tax=Rhizobium sp. P44RR-XXIV TaxID=1921145 RepID=UPI0009C6C492|nr:DMT family transporter [Rhizobium sp. P44RR-XXIV]